MVILTDLEGMTSPVKIKDVTFGAGREVGVILFRRSAKDFWFTRLEEFWEEIFLGFLADFKLTAVNNKAAKISIDNKYESSLLFLFSIPAFYIVRRSGRNWQGDYISGDHFIHFANDILLYGLLIDILSLSPICGGTRYGY